MAEQEGGGPSSGPGQAGKKGGRGSGRDKFQEDEAKKAEVAEKLHTGEYVLVNIDENNPLQSPAWKDFARVALPPPPVLPGAPPPKPTLLKFVRCRKFCGVIKMYSGGTGALGNHKCGANTAGGGAKGARGAPPPKSDVDAFQTRLIELLAGNVLPLSLASADEFHALVQEAIRIGHQHGYCRAADLIPHPTTLKRKVVESAETARAALAAEIREELEDGMCSATVDWWTDGQKQRKYLAHTVEFIDGNFELHDHLLLTPHCEAESVTAAVIKEEIRENLSSLSLDPEKVRLHYVTDDGADIVAAVGKENRTYCADHCTNLVVKKALHPQLTKLDLYGEWGGTVYTAVNRAVNDIKGLRQENVYRLKQDLTKGPKTRFGQTQFRSCMPMLKSVNKNFTKVRQLSQLLFSV
ncbi:Transposable element Hobo transposase [Frankliniella fusca]|uniref:Transposable element Hobo transposase n=1 Tax=Frankliniella fusca TaxID=407009 RepID=A0AAE1H6W3_9NEOP|nr:Transposable element Hobo transposase [Frankliniella fusca]